MEDVECKCLWESGIADLFGEALKQCTLSTTWRVKNVHPNAQVWGLSCCESKIVLGSHLNCARLKICQNHAVNFATVDRSLAILCCCEFFFFFLFAFCFTLAVHSLYPRPEVLLRYLSLLFENRKQFDSVWFAFRFPIKYVLVSKCWLSRNLDVRCVAYRYVALGCGEICLLLVDKMLGQRLFLFKCFKGNAYIVYIYRTSFSTLHDVLRKHIWC